MNQKWETLTVIIEFSTVSSTSYGTRTPPSPSILSTASSSSFLTISQYDKRQTKRDHIQLPRTLFKENCTEVKWCFVRTGARHCVTYQIWRSKYFYRKLYTEVKWWNQNQTPVLTTRFLQRRWRDLLVLVRRIFRESTYVSYSE